MVVSDSVGFALPRERLKATPGDFRLTCQARLPDYLIREFKESLTEESLVILREKYTKVVPNLLLAELKYEVLIVMRN